MSELLTIAGCTIIGSLVLTHLFGWRFVGITGGIASGKSTTTKYLKSDKHKYAIIDFDELAKELVLPGSHTLLAIRREFGSGVINSDGSLNREALGKIIFADPA